MLAAMKTREEWMSEGIRQIEKAVFNPIDLKMPEKWAVSCGWAKGASAKFIGICVDPICSADGTTHIFVVPTEDDGFRVLQVLAHEMIHAIVGLEEKHGGKFAELCDALGFSYPYTQALPEPGTSTFEALGIILLNLGPYPHVRMILKKKPKKESKWVRLLSASDEEYTVRISTLSIERFGMPKDPNGKEMLFADPTKDPRQEAPDPRQEPLPFQPTRDNVIDLFDALEKSLNGESEDDDSDEA